MDIRSLTFDCHFKAQYAGLFSYVNTNARVGRYKNFVLFLAEDTEGYNPEPGCMCFTCYERRSIFYMARSVSFDSQTPPSPLKATAEKFHYCIQCFKIDWITTRSEYNKCTTEDKEMIELFHL